MKQKFLPGFDGLFKDVHPRLIPDSKLSDGKNMLFEDGRIKRRFGYKTYGGNLPLNGAITHITYFETLRSAVSQLIVTTTRDTYLYNTATGNFDLITYNYIVGQAACAGTTAVTGAATTWLPALWTARSTYLIKFGTQTLAGTGTPNTWYTIDQVTGAGTLTLTAAGPNTGGNVNYIIRLCWSGDDEDYHDSCMPVQDTGPSANDRLLILTNGIDFPQKYTGTGTCAALGGSPNKAKYIADYYNHTILGWFDDTSNFFPQDIDVSDIGDSETWSAILYGIWANNDQITGLKALQTRLIVYKERSISIIRPTGNATDPFDIDENIADVGTPSGRTVVDVGDYHIFMGNTNVYRYDGTSMRPIGSEVVQSMLAGLNKEKLNRCFALHLQTEFLYILFVPGFGYDYCSQAWVYNYNENTWAYWEYDDLVTCAGESQDVDVLTWAQLNTLGTTWQAVTGRWLDYALVEGDTKYLVGDKDGYVYHVDPMTELDNATPISSYFVTKDYPLNDPKQAFKLIDVILGISQQLTGNQIRIKASPDFGATWSPWVTLDQAGTTQYVEKVANFIQTGKQVRFHIENISGAPFEIESFMIEYDDYGVTVGR